MTNTLKLSLMTGVAAATMLMAGAAQATNGMLPHCVGTVKCGKGGAGSARAESAVDASINPALAARMGNTYQVNLGWFWADVKGASPYAAAGQQGEQTSKADNFPNGSLGVNYVIDSESAFNISIVPGGGGASDWPWSRTGSDPQGTGISASDDQHVTYEMLYVQPSYAKKMFGGTVGVGGIFSRATMNTDSVNASYQPGDWADTDETFYGVGFQIGGVWDIAEGGSVGVNLRSPVWHQDTGVYDNNVFTDPIDTPMQAQVGVAFDATDALSFAADVKWVQWSSPDTIGNSPDSGSPASSRGFGWRDQTILMLGMDYDVNEATTLRAGFNHGNSPIRASETMDNFLFPAIVETHFTAGASYDMGNGMELGVSGYVTPTAVQRDTDNNQTGAYLKHSQKGFQISFSNDF